MDYRAVNAPAKGDLALWPISAIIVGVFLAIVRALVWSKGEVFGDALTLS
jgi:hypothetical protein